MTEKIFADGMIFKPAGPKAPEWVKGGVSIKVEPFIAFLQKHVDEKGWLNLDLKKSKGGSLYFELNTWKPNGQRSAPVEPQTEADPGDGDIPF